MPYSKGSSRGCRRRCHPPVSHAMQTGAYDRREPLPQGTVLREYTLESVLGHGGFGIVYRARHNESGQVVAIKEFLPIGLAVRDGESVRRAADSRDFEDALSAFLDEARALVAFSGHESVVACHAFFRAHGTGYLVMDFEEGRSLEEVLANREAEGRPIDDGDLLAVMVPLLEGLSSLHQAGLLHRDLKPSNILIRQRDRQPVMIDFGLAKHFVTKRSESLDPYTEGYAPLELVADAGEPGPRTDIYGIGAVMWRMVAGGQRPWEPPNPIRAERRSHAALGSQPDPLPSARKLGASRFTPNRLATIDRCLRLREAERFQGCDELLDALKNESTDPTGEWIFSDTAGSTETANKRRGWKVAAAAIAIVAVVVVAFTQGWGPNLLELVTGPERAGGNFVPTHRRCLGGKLVRGRCVGGGASRTNRRQRLLCPDRNTRASEGLGEVGRTESRRSGGRYRTRGHARSAFSGLRWMSRNDRIADRFLRDGFDRRGSGRVRRRMADASGEDPIPTSGRSLRSNFRRMGYLRGRGRVRPARCGRPRLGSRATSSERELGERSRIPTVVGHEYG